MHVSVYNICIYIYIYIHIYIYMYVYIAFIIIYRTLAPRASASGPAARFDVAAWRESASDCWRCTRKPLLRACARGDGLPGFWIAASGSWPRKLIRSPKVHPVSQPSLSQATLPSEHSSEPSDCCLGSFTVLSWGLVFRPLIKCAIGAHLRGA